MPEITLEKYEPLQGSPGEALWFEGEQSYIDSGYSDRQQATRPPPDLVGYVALVDGVPASITAYRYLADGKRVIAPLSYTRPEYRQMGLWHHRGAIAFNGHRGRPKERNRRGPALPRRQGSRCIKLRHKLRAGQDASSSRRYAPPVPAL